MMLGMAPDYDHLMVIQKVEVFEHALDSTSGQWQSLLLIPFQLSLVEKIQCFCPFKSFFGKHLGCEMLSLQYLTAVDIAGEDLHKMLWLKSRNSEVWLERRTGYTRSTAVMSMVGYLLGLGDRHPSNLMLDRYSGKLLHIDFGDCFEVSHRPTLLLK